jgi:hypothetical protein
MLPEMNLCGMSGMDRLVAGKEKWSSVLEETREFGPGKPSVHFDKPDSSSSHNVQYVA